MTAKRVDDALDNQVLRAWHAIDPRRRMPDLVELIKGRDRPRTIWRLPGAGPGGSAVIAKRCLHTTAALERHVYERILPRLPVSAPRYYGHVEDDDGFGWIFLEDVGRERIAFTEEAHRKLAARWLGTLHTSAVDVIDPDGLPDRGPAHYRRLLEAGKPSIEASMHNPALTPDQRRAIEAVRRALSVVEEEWGSVEQFCKLLPRTLVHGDFRRKNILVPAERTKTLFAIDWEFSGWGLVGSDLAPSRGRVLAPQVDLPTYVSVVHERWPDSDTVTFQGQAVVGGVLRRMAAVEWAAGSLGYPNVVKPIEQLETSVPEILRGLANAPWRRGRDQ